MHNRDGNKEGKAVYKHRMERRSEDEFQKSIGVQDLGKSMMPLRDITDYQLTMKPF
jgi:hypothetical protein